MSVPSIFNEVLGPVMRGPSSSHCAASLRIGRICRDLMNGMIEEVLLEFDPGGSLATTHESQGSDMGLFGGFLGWEADDERLPDYQKAIQEAGIDIKIDIHNIGAAHPNTYKITLKNHHESHELTALSVGGGMIEVIAIDGATVSMAGDYFETLIYVTAFAGVQEYLSATLSADEINLCRGRKNFIQVKAQAFPADEILAELSGMQSVSDIKKVAPVLPVLSHKSTKVPFLTCEEMLQYNRDKNLDLWQLAIHYEAARGHLTNEEVFAKMQQIVAIMRAAVDTGLQGTEYADRILGCQSVNFKERMEKKRLIAGDVLNRIIMFVTAIMEVKSSMGVIVAAPTAGSCGALPGAILGAASAMKLSDDETVKAMLAAGMIGVFISAHATFAAEVGGCQAECGSGAGMAAAGLVAMAGGDLAQSLSASSFALQNSFGMICDPVANRVEAPCLGKNVLAAGNALSCANMALADYDHLIPLDEVIDAMNKVGNSIPNDLCCTALGGLSITKTSKQIEERLQANKNSDLQAGLVAGKFKVC